MKRRAYFWLILFLAIIFAKETFAGSQYSWWVEFSIQANGTSDCGPGIPTFGVETGASEGLDSFDVPTPGCGPGNECLNLYFDHPEETLFRQLKKDIRAPIPSGETKTWDFYVQVAKFSPGAAILSWPDLSSVPAEYGLILKTGGSQYDMRQVPSFEYAIPSGERYFQVVVSNSSSQPSVPNISASPASHNFGSVTVGSSSSKTFTVSNTGQANLQIGMVGITGAGANNFSLQNDNCSNQTISPGGSRTLQAAFTPGSTGAKTATLSIPSNDPDQPNLGLALSGEGVTNPVPNISVSPTSHSFGAVTIGYSTAKTFTVSNTGQANLQIGTINLTGANDFSLQNDNCSNQIISPGGSRTLQAAFTPGSTGPKSATLSIPSNDQTLSVSLSGEGVSTSPAANFTATPLAGCAPCTVSFTDLSTGDITGWYWDFGDKGASQEQNPTHTYTTPGVYTISLNVVNGSQHDSETKTAYITVSSCPTVTADFSGTPTSHCTPCTVAFTDKSTGDIISYSWSFGDGNFSSDQNPTHTYTIPGIYTVSLTVFDGAYSSKTKTNYITINSCLPLTANFSAAPVSGYAPLEVNFTDLSTGDPTSWTWDFGDGDTDSVSSPTHTYTDSGTYIVALTVFNGLSDSETVSIVVIAPPEYFLDVLIYPNPCRTNSGDDDINFTGLPPDSSIRIYNIARELVRFEREIQGSFCWDIKNDDGRMVSPGVYIYCIEKDGRIKKGKIAVIR